MIFERGVRDEGALVAECGNAVTDDLGGYGRNDGTDYGANFLERRARRFGYTGEVFVNGLGLGLERNWA